MAEPPPAAVNRPVFIHTSDWNDGCLIYSVHPEIVVPSAGSGEPPALEIRPSAHPIARFSEEDEEDVLGALAVVSGTTVLGLVDGSRRTVVYDTATRTAAPGPRLRRRKRNCPAMLPVGDDTVVVMDSVLRPRRCCLEALRRLSGGAWRAEAIPDQPVAAAGDKYPCIRAYFAKGARAWFLTDRGAFSLDTDRRGAWRWRVEGAWKLPLRGRAFFVQELGLVIGLANHSDLDHGHCRWPCCHVSAVDVEARPAAVRHVWELPAKRGVLDPAFACSESLAYLGNGRFCVSRAVNVWVEDDDDPMSSCEEKGTSFTLLDVSSSSSLPGGGGGHLHLAQHGKTHCHVWPTGHCAHALFLQPACP